MLTRRQLLKSAAAAGMLGSLGSLTALQEAARAASSGDYKALVVIFQFGGNDGHNTLIPWDRSRYDEYAAVRQGLAVPRDELHRLDGTDYALHRKLPELARIYNNGDAAGVMNVGMLNQPLRKRDLQNDRGLLPEGFRSHINQQWSWQGRTPEAPAATGFAGRMSDRLGHAAQGQLPVVISLAGSRPFTVGDSSSPLSLVPGSPMDLDCNLDTGCETRDEAAQRIQAQQDAVSLMRASGEVTDSALDLQQEVSRALSRAEATGDFSRFRSWWGLSDAAKLISVRDTLGASRQIFFIGQGGYDSHDGQVGPNGEPAQHDDRLEGLNSEIGAFYDWLYDNGLEDHVTTVLVSEFGRTVRENSNNGSDHAWGSHLFSFGGAVNGGLYGTFPSLELAGPDDLGTDANESVGITIPTTGHNQYLATVARWFGVSNADLDYIFPSLKNFSTSDLGFMS